MCFGVRSIPVFSKEKHFPFDLSTANTVLSHWQNIIGRETLRSQRA
jgi:hypothetical protein